MNKNIFIKKIQRNLNNKFFFISDGANKLDGEKILQKIKIKLKIIKINKVKGSTIAIIKNSGTIEYWINFLVAMMSNFTVYPEIRETKITKYYKNIIKFDGENINFIKNKRSKFNKNLKKFDLIFSSSGSTGEPKLILQNFKSVLKNSIFVQKKIKFKKNKKFMMCTPYPFTSAICHFILCIFNGVSIYSLQKVLFPKDLNEIILREKINYFGGPPLHSKWIIESRKKKYIEKLISSGDFISDEVINKYLSNNYKFDFYYMYGLSEVGGRFCINKIKNDRFKFYVGNPLKYLNLKNQNNKTGEIIISSRYLFAGYYLKDKFYIRKDNYFYTGDIGKVDNKNLILSGRVSEIFKSSGVMIYPLMIKKVMMKSGWFKDVFVFKGYIEKFGNVPYCAYITKKSVSQNKIVDFLNRNLISYQIPKKFKYFKKFPRLGNNKIDKIKIINNF